MFIFNRFRTIKTETVIFLLIFLLLGYFSSQLFLYLDDAYFIKLVLSGDYVTHVKTYISFYGPFRPLALIYYYFIYPLYLHFPGHAHLLPLIFLIGSGVLIYNILLLQKLPERVSFFSSMIILSLPVSTEAYSWFSGNSGLYVYFLFFLQVYLLEKYTIGKRILFLLLSLQIIATYLYESTAFMPIAFGILWYIKNGESLFPTDRVRKYMSIISLLFIPFLFYIFGFILYPPQIETRIKFIDALAIINNWRDSLIYLLRFFFTPGQINFWLKEGWLGLENTIWTPITFAVLIPLILLLFWKMFSRSIEQKRESIAQDRLFFWGLCFFLSLIPLSWQPYYLSFRIMYLPLSILIIIGSFILVRINIKKKIFLFSIINVTRIIIISIIIFFLSVQIKMLLNYREQYLSDVKMVAEIDNKIEGNSLPDDESDYILIKNFPNNTLDINIYGDYIFSVFYHFWSLEYFYNFQTGKWKNIAVELQDKNIFRSKHTKKEFLSKNPLIIFNFTNSYRCSLGDCFNY